MSSWDLPNQGTSCLHYFYFILRPNFLLINCQKWIDMMYFLIIWQILIGGASILKHNLWYWVCVLNMWIWIWFQTKLGFNFLLKGLCRGRLLPLGLYVLELNIHYDILIHLPSKHYEALGKGIGNYVWINDNTRYFITMFLLLSIKSKNNNQIIKLNMKLLWLT